MPDNAVLDAPAAPHPAPVPRLAEGTELIGEYQGSGYRDAKYLVSRADGQVIQLPPLLYRLAAAVDGRRDAEAIAAHLSAADGRRITGEQVSQLLTAKLTPAGITAGPDGAPVAAPRPDPLLLLRFRVRVVPDRIVWLLAGVFRPFYWPPVLVALLAAFLALDAALVATGALGQVAASTIAVARTPALTLLVLAAVLASGVFHEFGHVAACRYGGARPGVMGVGIYLVWPAYYSTVTDSYRLSRAGRLRTDLGGVYFNAVFIAAMSAAYLVTGAPWLLLAIVAMHVQTAWQFLPSIRLDGYYILSDLIGLPDLFMFLGPVLRSVVPWRATDPRVAELRPGVRRTIVLWVLLVVPFLLFFLVSFLVLAPQVLPVIWDTVLWHVAAAAEAVRAGQSATTAVAVTQVLLLLLPVLGVTLLLTMIAGRLRRALLVGGGGRARSRAASRPVHSLLVAAVPMALLTVLAVAGLDRRIPSDAERALVTGTGLPWPDLLAARQIAAADALLGGLGPQTAVGAAQAALLVVALVGSLLLWPVARRLELSPPAAATAVALAGLPAPLVALHGTVDPGGLAAPWLAVAAGLAGRGRGASAGALGAAVLAALTAPPAAAALLAFAAHGMLAGRLGRGLRRRAARVLAAGLGAAAVGVLACIVADGAWAESAAGALAPGLLVAVLVAGTGLLVMTAGMLRGPRPVVSGAAVLLLCAAVPGPARTTALLVAVPVLAVLAALLLERTTPKDAPWRLRAALATVVAAGVMTSGPLVRAAAAPDLAAPAATPSETAALVGAVSPVTPMRYPFSLIE